MSKNSTQTPMATQFQAFPSLLWDLSIDSPWLFVFLTPRLPTEDDKQIEFLRLELIGLFQFCKKVKVFSK